MATRTPLAWLTLTHDKRRLTVSIAGIGLAVILMFMQVGFRNALFDSQLELIQKLDADLVLISKTKKLMYSPEPFARSRLKQARAFDGVARVAALYIDGDRALWKNARDGSTRPVRVLAFNPADKVLLIPDVVAAAPALAAPDTVLFDVKSRNYYGDPQARTTTELASRKVHVVGTFSLGTDFFTDGNVIMSSRNFANFFPDFTTYQARLDKVDIGTLKLVPGVDARAIQAALRQSLPDDVAILTKQEFLDMESQYWNQNTAIGFVFLLGTVVGFMVGMVICYQILYTNVLGHLAQFATLKAMGYSNAFLVGVVLSQGFLLAILGFFPALLICKLLYTLIAYLTGLLMEHTLLRTAQVLALTIGMCMIAGVIALRRVVQADPAEVF